MIYDVTIIERGKATMKSMDKPYLKRFLKTLIENDLLKTSIINGVQMNGHTEVCIWVGEM